MIRNECEKKIAIKAVKALDEVLELNIVNDNVLYKNRINTVKNDIQRELGAYLAKKELEKE